MLYATTGNRFQTCAEIRYSIVPDGTNLGGVQSNLVATFDKLMDARNWELAIFAAAAEWVAYASLNMVYVNDNGAGIGSGPDQQGDPNFGAIRIGGDVQGNNLLASTLAPPPAHGDSSSGDIFFNTGQLFSLGGNDDLETIMLHEFGHALGLGHSTTTSAVIYASYSGIKDDLTQDDIGGIQAVWGPRTEDPIARNNHNFTIRRDSDLTSAINANNQVSMPGMNVASPGESYWFKIKTPANFSGNLALVAQSATQSSLSPQVSIWDSQGNFLSGATPPDGAYGYVIGTQIRAQPNTYDDFEVSGATGDGSYALVVNLTTTLLTVAPRNTVVAVQPSQGGDAIAETAASGTKAKADPLHDFTHVETLRSVGDDLKVAPGMKQRTIAGRQEVTSHPVHTAVAHPGTRLTSRRLTASARHRATAQA